jgi:hypothetical protein
VLGVKRQEKASFLMLGRAGFATTGPVSKTFLRRFFQKAAAFFFL